MIRLRVWQSECIEQALKVFERQSHFLCHATPAAGKTVMVASVAKALLDRHRIDFVLCFSPSRTVAQSVASTFSNILGRSFNGQIGAAGGSYTYQSMNTLPAELWRVLSEHRVLVAYSGEREHPYRLNVNTSFLNASPTGVCTPGVHVQSIS